MSLADANAEYWVEYSNLQHIKHQLIHHYLNGWFPKMTLGSTGCRHLLYIDTHAGRGKHLSGRLGSPLVALTTLLEHKARARMLQNTEVRFHFIERDQENYAELTKELKEVPLPKQVQALPECGDGFEIIERGIRDAESVGGTFPPSFIFVDPFGFKLPGQLLRKLMTYPKVELFVNVIWRELDMAMRLAQGATVERPSSKQASLFDDEDATSAPQGKRSGKETRRSFENRLNEVFAADAWRTIDAPEPDARAEQCADLFRTITKARWGTHIRMLDNGRVRYFLLHLTNHPDGRDLMKECIWKACPDGGFYASKSDNPRQQLLVEPEPDFAPLCAWVKEKLATGPTHWQKLADFLREELWLETHLNKALRNMRNEGEIAARGTFGPKQNPRISLKSK
ncbi:MAG: three-Cys-motif partner protein TcmP [Planctomycetia bacterium]|nr:three-Cys-motif partner protein TcmP [Planctomycetia bacterium]